MATVPSLEGVSNFSICYWVKIDSSASFTNFADIWQVQSKAGNTTSVIRDEFRNTSYIGYSAIYIVKDATVGGSNTNSYYGIGVDNVADIWVHKAITKDGNYLTKYINGVQVAQHDCSNFESSSQTLTGYFQFGNGTSVLAPAWLQDWRLYDHALSAREVELISRGLVAHWPLSMPGNENLVTNLNQVYTSPASTNNSVYIGAKQLSLSEGDVQEGDQFTISFNYEVTGNTETAAYIYDQLNGSQTSPTKFAYMTNGNGTGKYVHTYSATETQAARVGSQYINIRLRNADDGAIIKVWDIKLERGDKATPWCPSPNSDDYATMGFDDEIEYDVSGYSHNGTKNNITYSSDTPRYNTSSVFNGSNSYIRVNENNWMPEGATELTINVWAYEDDWTQQTATHLFSCTDSGGFNTEAGTSGYLRFPRYVYTNAEKTTKAYQYSNTFIKLADLSSGWHMFTFIYNTSGAKVYIDGQLYSSETYTSYGIAFQQATRLFLGCEANGLNPGNPYINGKESDFRIYATVLSADQILDLYQTSASLSQNGTLLTNEITET